MDDVIRVGVIGTGFGATTVAPAFAATDGCEVVEVVSPRDTAAVTRLCGRADVDLVSIHSPPFLHLDHVRMAVAGGHPVLCDKPFGRTAAEAAEMLGVAERAGVVHLLNFERRYDPARVMVASLLREGAIGRPEHLQYSRFTSLPRPLPHGWLHQRHRGGGWVAGQGSHLIDGCRWLFGEVEQSVAVTRLLHPERPDRDGEMQPCDADDGFTAALRTESGVTAAIDVTVGSAVTVPERLTVFGSTGVIEIHGSTVSRTTPEGPAESVEVDLGGRTPLVASMERFAAVACEAVRAGVAPDGAPTFEDGLRCAEVMDLMGR